MDDEQLWEYRVYSIGGSFNTPKDAEVERLLDEWGAEGWELVSAQQPYGSARVRLIAKRPLTLETRRRRSRPG